ncbi:cyanamide hydratase [Aspergillus floccosus]
MCHQKIAANGWSSMPVNAGAIFGDQPFINKPGPLSLSDIAFPFDDPTVAKTLNYAKETLHPKTFNHSMRVYFYGMAITKQQFPEQAAALNPATWALTCLLHDLGTAEENLTATRMSFDIYGGIKALSVLKGFGATTDQAEAAAEAIIRHQDIGVNGTITYIGQLIQLATIYDNIGSHPHVKNFGELIHETTRAEVNKAYPRLKWCMLFASVIRKEVEIKPWCHSTHLVNFENEIEANELMRQWE